MTSGDILANILLDNIYQETSYNKITFIWVFLTSIYWFNQSLSTLFVFDMMKFKVVRLKLLKNIFVDYWDWNFFYEKKLFGLYWRFFYEDSWQESDEIFCAITVKRFKIYSLSFQIFELGKLEWEKAKEEKRGNILYVVNVIYVNIYEHYFSK